MGTDLQQQPPRPDGEESVNSLTCGPVHETGRVKYGLGVGERFGTVSPRLIRDLNEAHDQRRRGRGDASARRSWSVFPRRLRGGYTTATRTSKLTMLFRACVASVILVLL